MKYIYLPKIDFIKNWIEGGQIPLRSARNYLSHARAGSQTIDECKIQEAINLTGEQAEFIRTKILGSAGEMHGRTILLPNNVRLENVHLMFEEWDGVILCMSNVESKEICQKLGRIACVAIKDFNDLYKQINDQLTADGKHGDCKYTDDAARDVFTKSNSDAWQNEYRMYWPIKEEEIMVSIRPKTAKLLWTLEA